jgi:hypothetical protein
MRVPTVRLGLASPAVLSWSFETTVEEDGCRSAEGLRLLHPRIVGTAIEDTDVVAQPDFDPGLHGAVHSALP